MLPSIFPSPAPPAPSPWVTLTGDATCVEDIAVSGTQLNILVNQGNTTFAQAGQYPALIPAIVADLNKDGHLDIAGPFNGGGLGVMLGNGDGTFRAAAPYSAGSNPKSAVAADFNHDGLLDIAVLDTGTPNSSSDPGGVSILLGGSGILSRSGSRGPRRIQSEGPGRGRRERRWEARPDRCRQPPASWREYLSNLSTAGCRRRNLSAGPDHPGAGGRYPDDSRDPRSRWRRQPGYRSDLDCCSDSSTSYFKGNGDGTFPAHRCRSMGAIMSRL